MVEGKIGKFNNQIMRNLYIMLVMLDSPGGEGEIVNNFYMELT